MSMIPLLTAAAIAVCPTAGLRVTCVHDGDSLVVQRERIRIAEIDAPELHGRCETETRRAYAARDRLIELLAAGFTIERTGTDRYGRTLAIVRDTRGRAVSTVLISEGLARRYVDRRYPWC